MKNRILRAKTVNIPKAVPEEERRGLNPRSSSDTELVQACARTQMQQKIRFALESEAISFDADAGEDTSPGMAMIRKTTTMAELVKAGTDVFREAGGALEEATQDVGQAIPLLPITLVYGITALWLVLRLACYAALITPGVIRYVYGYFFDPRLIRRVRYGPNRRNFLDIYLPLSAKDAQQGQGKPLPVVVGVMGGAWVMGHRSWNTQLGLRLLDAEVILVAVDYRNFPIGHVPDMVEDVAMALKWVHSNIALYGGDPGNVVLHAQSAGAHLAALLLLERSIMEARGQSTARSASLRSLKACILFSGPYDLEALQPHMVSRGIDASLLRKLTVDGDLIGCSPFLLLESPEWKEIASKAADSLPPIYLFHGTADQAVPSWSSVRFAKKLQETGVKAVTLDIRPDFTHTLPLIEAPLRGKCDMQLEVILPFLLGEEEAQRRLARLPQPGRLLPEAMVRAAELFMPY